MHGVIANQPLAVYSGRGKAPAYAAGAYIFVKS